MKIPSLLLSFLLLTASLTAETIRVGGVDIDLDNPPAGLVVLPRVGVLTTPAVTGQLICEARTKGGLYETRACITPKGDFLLLFPDGGHYANKKGKKVNEMLAYRSKDRGKTWQGPTVAFDIDYSQHGFIPLIPRGTKRIYAFGTQPIPSELKGSEDCPIGFRWSDDDGHSWSKVKLIRPLNRPGFRGMSVTRMCETEKGTWLLGSHAADWTKKPLQTRQFILRSADRGETWTVGPEQPTEGWYVPKFGRMDEGRPIALGGGQVLMLIRTPAGHLWEVRSHDDGRTWSKPRATPLVHPDAPPMVFWLSDGKTLACFHHNRHHDLRYTGLDGFKEEQMRDRSEIWVATSGDQGRTWSEPRFVFANAMTEKLSNAWRTHQCSYLDLIVDAGRLHLIVPHRWNRVIQLTLEEASLGKLPTQKQLAAAR